eukprot:CAMPEP_0206581890 /NCGR_PEP_ID=MMETSP0325_2-20121206/34129_1 /ASSEMBLY_ACC=CAM_ASM_000347 /TAXON_ID=2866 /ORGANISM="Crypthecodinium cohnii, Strain Seligo" /LENGTH=304 /DNA_ID=CAMNT_0054088409 /DNA_START=98 /DNA_END=1009 /DNA_ORIENTATION=+
MAEAKKLRDLMKKEKERRNAGQESKPSLSQRPGSYAAKGAGRAAQQAQVRAAAGARAPAAAAAPSQIAKTPAPPTSAEPTAKRPRTEVASGKASPPPTKAASTSSPKATTPQAAASSAPVQEAPVETPSEPPTGLPEGFFDAPEEDGKAASPAPAAAAAPEAEADPEADAEGDEEAQPTLPEGFFDNPDEDAKVRGVEAPSIRAQRELEEGLKKFEREMATETERMEETRHEIDEEKYDQLQAEEEEFQSSLAQRLNNLKAKSSEKMKNWKLNEQEEDPAVIVARAMDEADEDSGSDVEFDWRA